jgi:nucleoside-diphosphate-sugar epimerase
MLVKAGHQVNAVARMPEKAEAVNTAGAAAVTIDLFDADAVSAGVSDRDAVIHLATNIPLGAAAARMGTWKTNDRLRTEAANNLASAVIDSGTVTYVGESITFPYLDGGSEWITESRPCAYHDGSGTAGEAEAAVQRVTDQGLVGVVLRFAMFHAADSGHIGTFLGMARLGMAPYFGALANYQSFVDTGDAARAVVAAFDVEADIYNVAEPNPATRAEHCAELARLFDKKRLRSLPKIAQKAGGKAVEELSRSQRVSSQRLQQAGGWEPHVDIITRWKDLT